MVGKPTMQDIIEEALAIGITDIVSMLMTLSADDMM